MALKVILGNFALLVNTSSVKISLPRDDSYSLVQSIHRMNRLKQVGTRIHLAVELLSGNSILSPKFVLNALLRDEHTAGKSKRDLCSHPACGEMKDVKYPYEKMPKR